MSDGFLCDVCDQLDLNGVRYDCLVCDDYDLCEQCFQTKQFNKKHLAYHPMQAVLPIKEFLLSLQGVAPQSVNIYRCPYCGDGEFTIAELYLHSLRYHARGGHKVRCPFCVAFRKRQMYHLEGTLLQHLIKDHYEFIMGDSSEQGVSFGEVASGVASSSVEECTICMEDLAPIRNTQHLRCGHGFHSACITTWLRDNHNCPICRTTCN